MVNSLLTTIHGILRETCLFPGVDREEAPAAESAPTSKRTIPLASLHRGSNVYGSAPLAVGRARFSARVSFYRQVGLTRGEKCGSWVEPRRAFVIAFSSQGWDGKVFLLSVFEEDLSCRLKQKSCNR